MTVVSKLLILFFSTNCYVGHSYEQGDNILADTTIHFYSLIDKTQFDTLDGTDFTWAIFEPIMDTIVHVRFSERDSFTQTLLSGQKALYYIWQLEGSNMQDGWGFTNFYGNYKEDYSEIIKSLNLIGDKAMIDLMSRVNGFYLLHREEITQKYRSGNWSDVQQLFSSYDRAYLDLHRQTMKLLEGYIRLHADEFVRFR